MALGCAYRIQGVKMCAIVKVSDDQIRAAGHDPAIFMRHGRTKAYLFVDLEATGRNQKIPGPPNCPSAPKGKAPPLERPL